MNVSFADAYGGHFRAARYEVLEIMVAQDGVERDYALDYHDMGNDPSYCTGTLWITKFEKVEPPKQYPERKYVIEGATIYSGKRRAFAGYGQDKERRILFMFDFTEPPVEMTTRGKLVALREGQEAIEQGFKAMRGEH